jgi:hypothetical protein
MSAAWAHQKADCSASGCKKGIIIGAWAGRRGLAPDAADFYPDEANKLFQFSGGAQNK